MNRKYRFPLLALLAILGSVVWAGGLAHAAPQAITITPTSVDQVIQPGSAYSGSFQVLDQGNTDYTFHVYSAPYHVKGEDYTPEFTAVPGAPKVADWFKFSVGTVHITPGQAVTVNYTITPPKGTPAGGYYATAFAETQYPKQANSITLNERVGEIFYLQIAGPVAQKGEVLSWKSDLLQKPPLTSTLRLQNNGGVHYQAMVQVNVRDIFGHSKYKLSTTKEVLPQTIRRISVPWQKTPSIGIFKVTGSATFLKQSHALPTKWVLVMSQTIRNYLEAALVLIVLFVVGRALRRHRSVKKAKR